MCTLLSLSSMACSPPKTDPAVLAYRNLVTQLTIGSSEGVWALLSEDSQHELSKRLGGGLTKNSTPTELALELDWAFESPFVGQATSLQESATSGETDERPERTRLIQTIYASQPWVIPVVFENGQWRVHLLGARQKSTL